MQKNNGLVIINGEVEFEVIKMATNAKELKNKIVDIISLLSVSILIFTYSFMNNLVKTDVELYRDSLLNLRYVMFVILFIIFVFKLVSRRFSIRTSLLIVFLFLITLFITFNTEINAIEKDNQLWCILPLWIALNVCLCDVEYRLVIKTICITMIILYSVKLLQIAIGDVDNMIVARGAKNDSPRFFLNTSWPTVFAMAFYYIVLYYIYVRNRFLNIYELLVLFISNLVIFYLTDSRSVFLYIIAFLVIVYVSNQCKCLQIYHNWYFLILLVMIIVVPILILLLYYFYNPDSRIMKLMNSILSNRPLLENAVLHNSPVRLFGNNDMYALGNDEYSVIESSFTYILYNYGIAAYLLVISALSYFSYMVHKKKDTYMFLVLVFSLIHAYLDLDFLFFRYNYLFFVLSYQNSVPVKISNSNNLVDARDIKM